MPNYRTDASSECIVPCTHEQYSKLSELLHDPDGQPEDSHDFTVDWVDARFGHAAGLYLCSIDDGSAQPDNLPVNFLVELGKLLSEAEIPHLSIGLAYTCTTNTVGSHGGETLRLYPNGALVYPQVLWPTEIPSPKS